MPGKLKVYALDQVWAFKTYAHSLVHRRSGHALPAALNKPPVVLIQGIMQKWNIFRKLIPEIAEAGHPVYVLYSLKRNRAPVETQASLVAEFLKEKNLYNVIIVGHSKGGLIGKHVLAFNDPRERILKLITLATPFHGTLGARLAPFGSHKEMIPGSKTLAVLEQATHVNRKIVSIYGLWDNAVMPVESSYLPGAKNIQVEFSGHHRMMFEPKVTEIILKEIG